MLGISIVLGIELSAAGLQNQYNDFVKTQTSYLNTFKKEAILGASRCSGRIVVDVEAANVRKYPVLRKGLESDIVGTVYKNMVLYYENRINGFYELCGGNTFIYATVVTRID